MCTKKVIGCMPSSMNNNISLLSDVYDCKSFTDNKSFSQMKIYFKNKFKLCTGIDKNTTFNDLKLAVLVSFCKAKSSKRNKPVKNYEYLKKKALNDYVICESVNSVEKIINSENKVVRELDRIKSEAIFLTGFKVIHIMRSKKHLMPMSQLSSPEYPLTLSVDSCDETEKVPILSEFFTEEVKQKQNPSTRKEHQELATGALIDEQLKRFDQFIEQRKTYIKLLEQYLDLVDTIEIENLPSVSRLETFV